MIVDLMDAVMLANAIQEKSNDKSGDYTNKVMGFNEQPLRDDDTVELSITEEEYTFLVLRWL